MGTDFCGFVAADLHGSVAAVEFFVDFLVKMVYNGNWAETHWIKTTEDSL